MARYALIQNNKVRKVTLGKPHESALPVEFPALSVTLDTHHITLRPVEEWEVRPGKVVATYHIEERDLEAEAAERERELREFREGLVVSRFQARAALHQAGMLDQVQTMMDDPDTDMVTKLAWQDAQEFKRLSPTVKALGKALGLGDRDLDNLFEQAALIEA